METDGDTDSHLGEESEGEKVGETEANRWEPSILGVVPLNLPSLSSSMLVNYSELLIYHLQQQHGYSSRVS